VVVYQTYEVLLAERQDGNLGLTDCQELSYPVFPEYMKRTGWCLREGSTAPLGLGQTNTHTHGWRRGLPSFAAPRLYDGI
jgi:hypothetical protein